MKNVIRMDLRISLIITFVWSIMSPYTSSLKGLLSVEVISVFMIVGAISMELLTILNKTTTFKSSTKYIIIYDAVYLVAVTIGYVYLADKQFIILVMSMTIPYWPLVRNAGNKYKALVGERYPRYFVEYLSTKMSVLETRVSLVAMGSAALIASLTPDPKYVVIVFIVISLVQSVWSVYSYKKYYVIFKK
jgi:hypothetical protein